MSTPAQKLADAIRGRGCGRVGRWRSEDCSGSGRYGCRRCRPAHDLVAQQNHGDQEQRDQEDRNEGEIAGFHGLGLVQWIAA